MMRRVLIAALALLAAGTAYVASPFVAAWMIREAIRSGDSAYLADKIEWNSLQVSLAPSLRRIALKLPEPDAQSGAAKLSLWQRVKARVGRGAVDRFVESYVTPEGLPQLFTYRAAYRQTISGEVEEQRTLANLPERIARFWARVKRAEFKGLATFELDVEDRHDPSRIYASVLELKGLEWKLTRLAIRSAGEIGAVAQSPLE